MNFQLRDKFLTSIINKDATIIEEGEESEQCKIKNGMC